MNYYLNILCWVILLETVSSISLSPKECKCKIKSSSKIIGGSFSKPNGFPWQISLTMEGFHVCGGFILNHKWVATASHCITDFQKRKYQVHVGQHYLNNLYSNFNNVYFIDKVYNHPLYKYKTKTANDIALIRLTRPIKFSDNIQPACLPKNYIQFVDGKDLFIASGWGRTTYKENDKIGLPSNALKQINLVYIEDPYNEFCDSKIICTFPLVKKESICNGDSGGPLHYIKNGYAIVVGISSFVYKRYPTDKLCSNSAFNRIDYMLDFIIDKIGDTCRY